MNSNVLILAAIAVLIVVGVLLATNKIRLLGGLAVKGVLGGAAIFGVNAAVGFLELGIVLPGVNFLTVGLVAFLGLPGFVMIYGVGMIV